MFGISIKTTIGIGDALQFSSLPENYFKKTGEKLFDVSRPWFFDYNPYVARDDRSSPMKVVELWNFSPKQYEWPIPRRYGVYNSNAEIWASIFKVPVSLIRPRLYQFEDYPFEKREKILLQTNGRSHGEMPPHVLQHVLKKYGPSGQLFQIGLPNNSRNVGLPYLETRTLWELAKLISEARMIICLDSGPAWIAACYPDVICKKLRTKPDIAALHTWTPMAVDNIHSHWDDRAAQIFNITDQDIAHTQSYRRI